MSTMYQTPSGPVQEPVEVDLWSYGGVPLGHVGAFDSMIFNFVERAADTATLVLPLTELTAQLLPCDGTVLIVARISGATHVSTPVSVQVASGDDPAVATVTVTSAGGWTLLDGQVIPPGLEDGLVTPDAEYEVTGPLETVVKRLITIGTLRCTHPVYILPDQGRGPTVTVSGAWETVGDTVKGLVSGTGFRLRVDGWAPGDPQPDPDLQLQWPCVVVDVVPYRVRDGLVWSVPGGDVSSWSVKQSRATATRVVVSNQADDLVDRYSDEAALPVASWWQSREVFEHVEDPKGLGENGVDPYRVKENLAETAQAVLSSSAASMEVSATIAAGGAWRFGRDGGALSYDVGDFAAVVLPVIGEVRQVITEVEVKVTPSEFSVTPTVGTPDSASLSAFASVADVARRVGRLERKS